MLKTTTFWTNAKILSKTTGNSHFLTLEAKLVFFQLKQDFIKAPIHYNFYSKCYIQIKIDASDYAIGNILSQLILKYSH